MSKHDISAGIRARQASARGPEPDITSSRSRGSEPSHNVCVRLPVSLDDCLEEQVLRVNQAARAAGQKTITKRELIELALREVVRRAPGEVLDLVS